MKNFLVILLTLHFSICLKAQDKQMVVPYTLSDRDRMMRIEARLNDFENTTDLKFKTIDAKLEETNKKIDRLEDKFDSYFMWGFGLVLMSIFGLTGFIIYDRRTTLAPVESKTERIIKALRETGEKDDDLKEALKRSSLL